MSELLNIPAAEETSGLTPHPRSRLTILLLLGALSTVSPFSIDMYLPAFDEIAAHLHTSVSRVSLSVSSYFVGLAFGQLFYGPLLDRFGRRRPLFVGLAIYLAATLACIWTSSIEGLIGFRVLQALGGCAASVASTAMVRDFFHPREAAKVFAILMLILGASPLLAPTVGSFVVLWWGWQVVFGLLGAIVLAILVTCYFILPEGHPPDSSVKLKIRPILSGFYSILKNRQFLTYAVASSFSFAGLFVDVAGSPAIFLETFAVSKKTYGLFFAMLSVGFIGGSQVTILLHRHFSSVQIFKGMSLCQMIVSLGFLVTALSGHCGLIATLVFLFLQLTCTGISSPNGAAIALAPFTKNAGSASSLLGFLQMGIGSLMSMGVGMFAVPGILPTVAVLATTSLAGFLILRCSRNHAALV